MATNLVEMFKDMGIDVEDSAYYSAEDGLSTNQSIENGQNQIRKIKVGFGATYHVILPVWLALPFNPITLEPLKKGKTISSYKLGKTSAQVLRAIGVAAMQDEEYHEKLEELVGLEQFLMSKKIKLKKDEKFDFTVAENGDCSPLLAELYSKYFNFYTYTGQTQRYNFGVEQKVSRAALIPLKPSGMPDLDAANPMIALAYNCESSLLYDEILKTEENMKKNGATKASIDDAKSSLRQQRIMTRPTESAFVYGYAFDVDSSHAFSPDDSTRYNNASYKLSYAQAYFRIISTDIPQLMLFAKQTLSNVNYVEVIRAYPAKAGESDQLGLCAQKVNTVVVFGGKSMSTKIDGFSTMVEDFLEEEGNTDPEEVKKFIRELEPVTVEQVLAAVSNNINQYKLALNNPEVVEKNRKFLSMCEDRAGLTLVKNMSDNNRLVIDVNAQETTPVQVIEDSVYFDSDEGYEESKVSASAFMPQA